MSIHADSFPVVCAPAHTQDQAIGRALADAEIAGSS
jgi:hypothetical protein